MTKSLHTHQNSYNMSKSRSILPQCRLHILESWEIEAWVNRGCKKKKNRAEGVSRIAVSVCIMTVQVLVVDKLGRRDLKSPPYHEELKGGRQIVQDSESGWRERWQGLSHWWSGCTTLGCTLMLAFLPILCPFKPSDRHAAFETQLGFFSLTFDNWTVALP